MNCIPPCRPRGGHWLMLVLSCALALPAVSEARDPIVDTGKGFDYVFYGYSPPNPGPVVEGSSRNRAMLLLDIDKPGPPRPYPAGPQFKLLAESPVGSGELEVLTIKPTVHTLIGAQDNNPVRFVFTFRGKADNDGGAVLVQSDAALEANGLHYLRDVVDVVHKSRRTRYLVNCDTPICNVLERPY